ncbi:MAG: DNA methyltransferase [Chloroflexi bacterium]|nr:DNA methyltransferase [Chloroflexota bacterium]
MSKNNRILYAQDCYNTLNNPHAIPDDSIDLIYLDPPFNSNSVYNLPFKGKYRSIEPVAAFKDTWSWDQFESEQLSLLELGDRAARTLASIVNLSKHTQPTRTRRSPDLSAYLLNMAIRILPMRRVLKENGSIYLHCDQTAGHYLKLILDAVFGDRQFRNEIIWFYHDSPGRPIRYWPKKHDTIFFYTKSPNWTFNGDNVRIPILEESKQRYEYERELGGKRYLGGESAEKGKIPEDVWSIPVVKKNSSESLGYPTQKPLRLMRRIIKASSNVGDLVLDPFCGCGTTVHAAEELNRRWIGIDISRFATELIHQRIDSNFNKEISNLIQLFDIPRNVQQALDLAERDRFEFEKWVCGYLGAEGMYRDPGRKGRDGGIDGVLKFEPLIFGTERSDAFAIIQVKSGRVTADNVRALNWTVRDWSEKDDRVKAGILVCFRRWSNTVENNRYKQEFRDSFDKYPVIQCLTVEDMLEGIKPDLPGLSNQKVGRVSGEMPT